LSLFVHNSGQSNFEFECLSELENEFENILGGKSGAEMGLIDEKNHRSKISYYCPFNNLWVPGIQPNA
jgi:hypothetical protein